MPVMACNHTNVTYCTFNPVLARIGFDVFWFLNESTRILTQLYKPTRLFPTISLSSGVQTAASHSVSLQPVINFTMCGVRMSACARDFSLLQHVHNGLLPILPPIHSYPLNDDIRSYLSLELLSGRWEKFKIA